MTTTHRPTADEVQAFADMLRSHDGDQMAADMLAAAAKRISDLERQLAEARVDAERYRWLRTANCIDWDAMPPIINDGQDMPELLDAAIDAARRNP